MAPRKIQRVNFTKNSHEETAWSAGSVVCGIDEVGRGCLAGPLVTAAVILPPNKNSRLIKDSKVLTEPERQKAMAWIAKHCWYGIGIVSHRTIDRINIWNATLLGMKRALVNLLATCPLRPSAVLVDAMPLTISDTILKDIPVHHFPKGERLSSSIAAASIVAKVYRDELMAKIDLVIPGYHLDQHKGYGTAQHQEMIRTLHHSIVHRVSFLDNFLPQDDNEAPVVQQSLLAFAQEPEQSAL